MDANKSWTNPEDFGDNESVIKLPDRKTRNGEPVQVLIRQVDMEDLIPAMQGLPNSSGAAGGQRTFGDVVEMLSKWAKPAEQIARLGIVSPQFYFPGEDPKPGHARWGGLSIGDRAAIVNGVLAASGFGASAADSALTTFPDKHGSGGSNGSGTGDTVQPADSAAPAPSVPWTQA